MRKDKNSSWWWYAVVLLFESTISGEPDEKKIDDNYSTELKLYQEQIVLFRAQSHDHAFKLADLNAKKQEMVYTNKYGQNVQKRFVDSVNCQKLFDNEIKAGTELYYRLYEEKLDVDTSTFLEKYLPETRDDSEKPLYNFLIYK